jgi:predicted metal-dependent phosphoesterase TrpH
VNTREQAFTQYLGRGKPLFVPRRALTFDQAVALIKESEGIAVLAHPMSLYIAWGRLPSFVQGLKDRGLDGLEAWHPTAKSRACKRLEALGRSLGLCVTEGSDFHGDARPNRKLGHSAENREIADSVLEALPELCAPLSPGIEKQ